MFVLFLHLYEYAGPMTTPRSPLEPDGPETLKEREEREKQERRRDAELAREIAERKKSTNERGIKLTVVLMASRRMLDDPTLDSRLTHIRRSSGLDSRAALFVLSPVSLVELTDFVRRLAILYFSPNFKSLNTCEIVYSKRSMILLLSTIQHTLRESDGKEIVMHRHPLQLYTLTQWALVEIPQDDHYR